MRTRWTPAMFSYGLFAKRVPISSKMVHFGQARARILTAALARGRSSRMCHPRHLRLGMPSLNQRLVHWKCSRRIPPIYVWRYQRAQERELSHEKEEERQVERAKSAEPLNHRLDPAPPNPCREWPISDVVRVRIPLQMSTPDVKSCRASWHKWSCCRMGYALPRTSLTIQLSLGDHNDDFLPPVQWILTTTKCPQVLLLISPFEANELVPMCMHPILFWIGMRLLRQTHEDKLRTLCNDMNKCLALYSIRFEWKVSEK